MDFDREYELEDAGIDAFDFSLMDDDEKAEALRDAGLDPDDFDGIEFESSFEAWSSLQSIGVNLWDLEFMDDDEKREVLEKAGLDPEEYDLAELPGSYAYDSPSAVTKPLKRDHAKRQKEPAASVRHPVVYRCCEVYFPDSHQKYSYFTNGWELSTGDVVLVPTGPNNIPNVATVVSVGNYTAETAPYPVERMKAIIRKATEAESAPFRPQSVPRAVAPEEERKEPARPQPTYVPTKTRNHSPAWWIVALAAVFAIIVLAGQSSGSSTTRSTSSTYSYTRSTSTGSSRSYSSTYSSTPTCPPVNREKAMTKEEADRLRGTGYHGTRPNSSAEDIELKAAQTKCKNCGYRTHNGVNSLCDYCRWMEQYGGGLPKNTAATPAPKATPRATPKPTEKPKESDPYHASDYSYPEDFYEDYYDDFWDYEDAEEYWERYH